MSALGFPSPLPLKGQSYSGLDIFASDGDSKMIGHSDVEDQHHATSSGSYSYVPSKRHHYSTSGTSSGSSPSGSPSASTSALPLPLGSPSQSISGSNAMLYSQQCVPDGEDISALQMHPQPSPATPPLPEYRPLPPLSPEAIIAMLDHLASTTPKKKSHARKQPAGHIPRPRNAFILFRCVFVSQQAVPSSVEKDHRNISRIAGRVWKAMSHEDRDPWQKAAEIEKARHEQKWPGYRYNPVQNPTQAKRLAGASGLLSSRAHDASGFSSRFPDSERTGRTMARGTSLANYEDEDRSDQSIRYTTPFTSQPIGQSGLDFHIPFARMASVPLPSVGSDSQQVDDADMMPSTMFVNPFLPAPSTPTPSNFARLPTPQGQYNFATTFPSLPPPTPLSPCPLPPFGTRRSSSCPPLPPPGMFPFNAAAPWGGNPSSSIFDSSPVNLASGSDTPPPFINPFPSSSQFQFTNPFAVSLNNPGSSAAEADEGMDEHRPLAVVPQHHLLMPRHAHSDTPSRLTHRRGSSLDRAIASSSIAGVFGGLGGYSRSSISYNHWHDEALQGQQQYHNTHYGARGPSSHFSQQQNQFFVHPGIKQEESYLSNSSDADTPALSPSPPSSYGGSQESQNEMEYRQGRQPRETESVPSPSVRVTPEPFSPSSSRGPSSPTFVLPARKVSARLFGSQGVRLGLDLDLDAQLSLDVSFKDEDIGAAPYSATSSTNSHAYSSTSIRSGDSDSPSFPYTPASVSASPAPFSYSYTQALMDSNPEAGAGEFRPCHPHHHSSQERDAPLSRTS